MLEASELIVALRELTDTHERLLEATRELLASYPTAPAQSPAGAPPASSPAGELSVSAGPFASTEALRAFERALGRLPEVREVTVREYGGGDRVVVDVQLFEPTS